MIRGVVFARSETTLGHLAGDQRLRRGEPLPEPFDREKLKNNLDNVPLGRECLSMVAGILLYNLLLTKGVSYAKLGVY